MTRQQQIAVIAAAFLDGVWQPDRMAARAAHDLGLPDPTMPADPDAVRPDWLVPLARAIATALPSPPLDAPRELRRLIGATGLVPRRGPATARTPALVATGMGPTPWPEVLAIPDVGTLERALGLPATQLDRFADVRSWERTAPHEALRHYRYRWRQKGGGGARLIEAPKDHLRGIQRMLLRDVLDHIPPHPAATGFRPGGSVHAHAHPHAGKPVVIVLDLEGFFASIGPGRVFATYRTAGYPEPVAHLLTGLATNAVPDAVLAQQPLTWWTRRHLAGPHLPAGAPTSPALANLAARRLDRRLHGLAARFEASYTRYADDLALSGGDHLRRDAGRLVRHVTAVAEDEGFRLNRTKTRVMPRWTRQRVAGLVVNDGLRVPREERDRLRAILHDAARNGPATANRGDRTDFAAHILGRIAWVAAAHPGHGAQLREAYDRIDWSSAGTDRAEQPSDPP